MNKASFFLILALSGAALLTTGCQPAPPASGYVSLPLRADFFMDELWDEGLAEMNIYEAREVRYGLARPARVQHIVVKEPFNVAKGVKSDGVGDVEVIKMNQIISVPTGTYQYQQQLSLFTDRKTARLRKWSLASHEACGNTFKMGSLKGSRHTITYHTYWEERANGTLAQGIPSDSMLYDEMPLVLRALDWKQAIGRFYVHILPPQISPKANHLTYEEAILDMRPGDHYHMVKLSWSQGEDILHFETQFPHRMTRWERADGSVMELSHSVRLDYWNRNRPGDETLLNRPSDDVPGLY